MADKVLKTMMISMLDLFVYQFKRFALGAWVLLVIAMILGFYSLRNDTARLSQLEKTNCHLKQFSLKAAVGRIQSANLETGARRKADIKTAFGYERLAVSISGVSHPCILPRVPALEHGH